MPQSSVKRGHRRPRRTYHAGRRSRRPGGKFQKKTIDPRRFINKNPTERVEQEYVPQHTFADFAFDDVLHRNLAATGFDTPTRIQDQAIRHVLDGRDVIGLANTGSGKTGAFILPIIHNLVTATTKQRAFIVAPTRELADQIDAEFRKFALNTNLRSVLCVGGVKIDGQIKTLARNPEVIIGTPGRLKDLVDQGKLSLDDVSILVVDEADRMLDMGFIDDIRYLTDRMPRERQSLCFSATITPPIEKLLDSMLHDPVTISVRTSETGEHIAQDVVRVRSKDEKFDKLAEMLEGDEFSRVLVFAERKHDAQKLAKKLSREGVAADAIHGNKTQPQRQRSLRAFKEGEVNVLVATDVAARGLDINNVSHVINYDQPNTYEDYIHRIGRTGRAGKVGQAYTFVEGR